MNNEQRLEAWFGEREEVSDDMRQGVARVMSEVPQTRQHGRWLPLPLHRPKATSSAPSTTDTTEYQPSPIPATNGHSPTVIGRTQSMFSPVKAITAGALVFALGGMFLIAQPFDQQGGGVPGAAQGEATAVEFTGAIGFGPSRGSYWDSPIVEPFTDPRLAGEFGTWANIGAYPGGPTFFAAGFSMHDDDGGWIQRPGLRINHPDGTSATTVIVMDGQGAYDGLTVVAEVSLTNERYDWHGYIVDGELPPAPTIELPE